MTGVQTCALPIFLSPEFKTAGENIYYIPGQALSADIDFDLIKSNFAQFEDIQAGHKVTSEIGRASCRERVSSEV